LVGGARAGANWLLGPQTRSKRRLLAGLLFVGGQRASEETRVQRKGEKEPTSGGHWRAARETEAQRQTPERRRAERRAEVASCLQLEAKKHQPKGKDRLAPKATRKLLPNMVTKRPVYIQLICLSSRWSCAHFRFGQPTPGSALVAVAIRRWAGCSPLALALGVRVVILHH